MALCSMVTVLFGCLVAAAQVANGDPTAEYELTTDFYKPRCPQLDSIVRAGVEKAIQIQPRNAASLLRLFFHDCFVNGCDASILLDDIPPFFIGEKTASPNNQSARGYELIDAIKFQLEQACPGVVSCADVLAIVARDAVVLSGGPYWDVTLGRRDSLTASRSAAEQLIPSPTEDLPQLVSTFQTVGLDIVDLVSLAGAHTIGFSRCTSFTERLYNQSGSHRPEGNIRPELLNLLRSQCPYRGNPDALQPLDRATPATFDNHYYQNLVVEGGLLHSDGALYSQAYGTIRDLVEKFSYDEEAFFDSFAKSIIKMGNMKPLTGSKGEIRKNCWKVNERAE